MPTKIDLIVIYTKVNVHAYKIEVQNWIESKFQIKLNSFKIFLIINWFVFTVWVDAPDPSICGFNIGGGRCVLNGHFGQQYKWLIFQSGEKKKIANEQLWDESRDRRLPYYQGRHATVDQHFKVKQNEKKLFLYLCTQYMPMHQNAIVNDHTEDSQIFWDKLIHMNACDRQTHLFFIFSSIKIFNLKYY